MKETDAAGNISTATSNFTVTGDTTAPTTAILAHISMVQLEPINVTTGYDYARQITVVGSTGEFVVTWRSNDSDTAGD